MRETKFQGWPYTEVNGEAVCISLSFRDPDWVKRRGPLWRGGNLCLVIFAAYQYFTMQLQQIESAAFLLIGGSLAWWVVVNQICWRSRSLCFTPEHIIFQKGRSLFRKIYDRTLPHGFRVQGFGQHQGYHVYMDHLQETVLIGDVYGDQAAELIVRRLTNVSEFMNTQFPSRHVDHVEEDARQRRSTFARG